MPSPDLAPAAPLVRWEETAMASRVAVSVPDAARGLEEAARLALDVFADVEQACSRFRPTSGLSRCNARPGRWHHAPQPLVRAVEEAARAHRETGGTFDPRVHDRLVQLGYDRSFASGPQPSSAVASPVRPRGPWRPRTHSRPGLVHLGGSRIDLGGIGKGLALRWSAEVMRARTEDFLIEAGGDVITSGSPGSGGWRIGVEAPDCSPGPLAVLEVSGLAVATSSVRIRQWKVGEDTVHHLIDPATGQPGGGGLLSVTVVDADPAWAEVWSKTLFLAGLQDVARTAVRRHLAALWVGPGGVTGTSPAMDQHVVWARA